jgi:hypothetical protein
MTCLVYYHRRLRARRDLLRETLTSMGLDDYYMRMRHPEKKCLNADEFRKIFDADFRSGLSASDYVWPVSLFTAVSLLGWYETLSRLVGETAGLKESLPVALAFGFVGSFLASLFMIFDDFRTLSLDPGEFYSATNRVLFSSVAAYVVSLATPSIVQGAIPLVSLGIGLIPVEDVRNFIVSKTSQLAGTAAAEGERGLGLKVIQGLEDRETRSRLVEMNIATVQALATCEPFTLFFQTTLPLRAVIDMIDKAILYLYIGDAVTELRQHGINGVIELVALAHLGDQQPAYDTNGSGAQAIAPFFKDVDATKLVERVATLMKQEPDELKAFIYNCYYDPQVSLIYDIWGKYLNPQSVRPAAAPVVKDTGAAAAAAGGSTIG